MDRTAEGTGAKHRMKTNLILVAAPSGAGKSSFVERLVKEDTRLVDIITFTTRSMRKGESEGQPYHFISKAQFEEKKAQGFFVESALVHTNFYGTPKDQLEQTWRENRCAIMDVDVQGTRTLKGLYPKAFTLFILPPSIEVLKQRILKRDGGVPEDFEVRLQNAQKEIEVAKSFDFSFVNDEFDLSFQIFKKKIEELL